MNPKPRQPDTWPIDQVTIAAIGAMEDRGLRNRLITQTYHRIATAMSATVGSPDANWYHFATWASFSVGQIMRGEILPPWVRKLLVGDGTMLGNGTRKAALLRELDQMAGSVAADLAEGNVSVFREMAPAGAAFVAAHGGRRDDRVRARAVLDEAIRASPPVRGKNCLAIGFDAFGAALGDIGENLRAQLVLAGSMALGAAEQARLDPVLTAVLSAAPDDVMRAFERRLRWPLLSEIGRMLDTWWDREMTRRFLVLEVPGERLRLGRDVPALAGEALIPVCVADVDCEQLQAMLDWWDRTGGTGIGDAALNWASLDDRMCWIGWLFRSRIRDGRLGDAPFDPAAVEALRRDLRAA